jgi:hypothetical protein
VGPSFDDLAVLKGTYARPLIYTGSWTPPAEQLPYIWIPDPYQIQAVSSKLHGVTFSPFYTLLPEYWYFTK